MNIELVLQTLHQHEVEYLLIGGVNFLLRHEPVATYDIDIWIKDNDQNIRRCEQTLSELNAEWGRTDEDWGLVADKRTAWLSYQAVYSLMSPHGAIDVFRAVRGLPNWDTCREPNRRRCPILCIVRGRKARAKRGSGLRWRVIQEFLNWAEQQQTVPRNSKEECLRLQAEKLRFLEENA